MFALLDKKHCNRALVLYDGDNFALSRPFELVSGTQRGIIARLLLALYLNRSVYGVHGGRSIGWESLIRLRTSYLGFTCIRKTRDSRVNEQSFREIAIILEELRSALCIGYDDQFS